MLRFQFGAIERKILALIKWKWKISLNVKKNINNKIRRNIEILSKIAINEATNQHESLSSRVCPAEFVSPN